LLQRDEFKGFGVRAFQHHRRGHAGFKGFLPAAGAQAPAVAGFEARKAVFGARGDQVVAPLQREI
jgi:hypothetical protein